VGRARGNQRSAGDTGGGGRGQAGDRGRRRSRSTGDAAASEPLDDDQLNANANVNASAATKEGSELSTSLPGEDGQALATSEEAESTAEVDAQGSEDGLGQEAGDINEETANKVERGLDRSSNRQPEQDDGL
jgi:hypothetical protein